MPIKATDEVMEPELEQWDAVTGRLQTIALHGADELTDPLPGCPCPYCRGQEPTRD